MGGRHAAWKQLSETERGQIVSYIRADSSPAFGFLTEKWRA